MQRLVKGIHIQRSAAYVDDLIVALRRLQQVQILIDQLQIAGMQGNGTALYPVLLIALKQIARVQADDALIILLRFLRQLIAVGQLLFQVLKFIKVNAYPGPQYPAVGATLGGDALRQRGTDLRQDHAQTADQRLQGAFRVAAAFARPQRVDQAIDRHVFAVLKGQVLQKRHALAGLGHGSIHAFRAAINMKAAQQGNTDVFVHGGSSFHVEHKYAASAIKVTHMT